MKGYLTIILICISLLAGCATNKEPLFNDYKTLDMLSKRMGDPDYHLSNRYVWDKRYSQIVADTDPGNINKISFAEANYAYMHNKYCHVTVVTDKEQNIIFREIEGDMCRSIYGPIFINSNVSHNVRLDGQGFFYAVGSILGSMLQGAGEAVKNMPDYDFTPIPNFAPR